MPVVRTVWPWLIIWLEVIVFQQQLLYSRYEGFHRSIGCITPKCSVTLITIHSSYCCVVLQIVIHIIISQTLMWLLMSYCYFLYHPELSFSCVQIIWFLNISKSNHLRLLLALHTIFCDNFWVFAQGNGRLFTMLAVTSEHIQTLMQGSISRY